MSKGLTANYSRAALICGASKSIRATANVKIRTTLRVVRGDKVVGERCQGCSGYTFKIGKGVQPTLSKEFKHRKGCRLA